MDDYEIEDEPCPACGAMEVRWCDCGACEDGMIDRYDEDPLWYDQGDYEPCEECGGFGILRWCRACGWDQAHQPVRK